MKYINQLSTYAKTITKKIIPNNEIQKLIDINAKQIILTNNTRTIKSINDTEFKISSQWGEDGIIQYLIYSLPIKNKTFIEFGVENYTEANTRFLLRNNNWSGLVIDASKKHINYIKKDEIYWKYDIEAVCRFITKDNINQIINNYIISHNGNTAIGLLSIDLDGNDYWIWDSITAISPDIVICEYNWILGNNYPVSVPYDTHFNRTEKHHSNLYFGASLPALCKLGEKKGYSFIGSNLSGNNAFFVKTDLAIKYLPKFITTTSISYHKQKAKESRNKAGNLTFIRGNERVKQIKDMTVVNTETGKILKINELETQTD